MRKLALIAGAVVLGAATSCTVAEAPESSDTATGSGSAASSGSDGVQSDRQLELVSSDLTAGLGLPFSEAVRVGDLLFLSGMIGMRPGTLELVPGGMEAEARQTMENIRSILAAAGASPDDIVKCTVMLDDMAQWGAFNQVYVEFFGEHRPARSALGADGLALGAAVEVECIAAAPMP